MNGPRLTTRVWPRRSLTWESRLFGRFAARAKDGRFVLPAPEVAAPRCVARSRPKVEGPVLATLLLQPAAGPGGLAA